MWGYYLITTAIAAIAAVMTAVIMHARGASREAAHRARLEERDRQLQEQRRLLDPQNGQLKGVLSELLGGDFERLANRVIDQKTRVFSEQSDRSLKHLLEPFRDQIADFKKQHETHAHRSAKEQQMLLDKIAQTQELNRQLSDQAEQLTKALRGDAKAQGSWGEISLQRVLEQLGLKEGREYDTQVHIPRDGGEGRLRADVILHLPQSRDVIIDAKVSLTAYTRLIAAHTDEERRQAAVDHAKSVRNHVKELETKHYQHHWRKYKPKIDTEEHVLMFIPIEGVIESAIKQDGALLSYAHDSKVMMVGPTALIVVLHVLEKMWRIAQQNSNIDEIFIAVGRLYDKCAGFVTSMEEIGTHLGRTENAYNTAFSRLSKGKGNVVSTAEKIKNLGARTTKQIADHESDELL